MLQHKKPPAPMRRKADVESWESTVDALSKELCTPSEWQDYLKRQSQYSKRFGSLQTAENIAVLPVWKKYRKQASRLATLYRSLPVCRHLPVRVSVMLSEIIYR